MATLSITEQSTVITCWGSVGQELKKNLSSSNRNNEFNLFSLLVDCEWSDIMILLDVIFYWRSLIRDLIGWLYEELFLIWCK